jgi:hypothetical protein
MLRIDIQAEMIQSFQEEKRRRFLEARERERATAGARPSIRTRLLRASGGWLIEAGLGLQKIARAADYEHGKLGEVG